MSFAELVLVLIVAAVAGLALYIAIKAHLHHTTLAGEVKNQEGKIQNVQASVDSKVAAAVADLKAKV